MPAGAGFCEAPENAAHECVPVSPCNKSSTKEMRDSGNHPRVRYGLEVLAARRAGASERKDDMSNDDTFEHPSDREIREAKEKEEDKDVFTRSS